MKLEEMYTDYNSLGQDERLFFVIQYRQRRAFDLSKVEEKKSSKKQGSLLVSEEEKVLMKLLGIKAKDIIAFRALKELEPTEESSPEEDAILFGDDNLLLEAEE